jgi:HEAT repeat protein
MAEATLSSHGKQPGVRLRTLLMIVAVCAVVCGLGVEGYRNLSPVRRSADLLQPANSAFVKLGAVSTLADPNWLPPWERDEAFRILVRAIDDPDAHVRLSAAMALTRRRDHENKVISLLLGLTKDKEPRVREAALFALEGFRSVGAPKAQVIRAAALAALDDPNSSVRLEAGRAFYVFGQGQIAVPAMAKLVREENGSLRLGALCWLELANSIPKDLEPILRDMVKSDNVTERMSGRSALFHLGISDRERDAMIDAGLRSPHAGERIDAAARLIKLRKGETVIPVLRQIAASDDKPMAARAERMLFELECADAPL